MNFIISVFVSLWKMYKNRVTTITLLLLYFWLMRVTHSFVYVWILVNFTSTSLACQTSFKSTFDGTNWIKIYMVPVVHSTRDPSVAKVTITYCYQLQIKWWNLFLWLQIISGSFILVGLCMEFHQNFFPEIPQVSLCCELRLHLCFYKLFWWL